MRTATRATGNARTEMDELPKDEFFALNCRLHKALLLTYDEAEALGMDAVEKLSAMMVHVTDIAGPDEDED